MSRLYDRARVGGVRPATLGDFHQMFDRWAAKPEVAFDWQAYTADLAEQLGRPGLTVEEARALSRAAADRSASVTADEHLEVGALDDAVVFVADEVAAYTATIPGGRDMSQECSLIAPPFERFWIEFRGPNHFDVHSWGLLVNATELDPATSQLGERWLLEIDLVLEHRKGDIFGPAARYLVPVTPDGRMVDSDDDRGKLFAMVASCVREDDEAQPNMWADELNQYLFAGLLTLSFTHCKNVDTVDVDPPEALSRKYQRRTGVPLTRYRTLDIGPMREVLDRDGGAQTNGLRKALHICRGHFKTYSEDAPLFGRHVGTYWWADRLAGDPGSGRVEKDYEVKTGVSELGRDYIPANETPPSARSYRGGDPDLSGRGVTAHNRLQNQVAALVTEAGLEPLSPRPADPQFDLAWLTDTEIWLVEVKSMTDANEMHQMHRAIGQITDYAHRIDPGDRQVRRAIVVEQQPNATHWYDLLRDESIVLAWPGCLQLLILEASLRP